MDTNSIETKGEKSPELEAEEELLKFGLQTIPENIKAVIDQQKTLQHPGGYEDVVRDPVPTIEEMTEAMKGKNIQRVIHVEGPSLWIHSKLAMTLAGFLNIPEDKKADLKLVMLYHDLGKTMPGLSDRPEVREIQQKELERGKLYKVAKGHAAEGLQDVEAGFRANGVSGRKLEIFMNVVKNHMETQLANLPGTRLVELFDGFGKNDEEKREVAEMLAWAVQVDGNACMHAELYEGEANGSRKKLNTTGVDFDKIWTKYQEAKKQQGV